MENKKIITPLSLLFFFLLGSMQVINGVIRFSYFEFFLDLIPYKKAKTEVRIDDIKKVTIDKSFKPVPLVLGFLIYVSGVTYSRGGAPVMGTIIYIIGGLMAFSGITSVLILSRNNAAGGDFVLCVPVFFKEALIRLQKRIEVEKFGHVTEQTRKWTEMKKRDYIREQKEKKRQMPKGRKQG